MCGSWLGLSSFGNWQCSWPRWHPKDLVTHGLQSLLESPSWLVVPISSVLQFEGQQLYQVLALNCKGEAFAMTKALAAAGEHEARRGVTAWFRVTRGHRDPVRNESWDWLEEFFKPNVVRKCEKFFATSSCGKVALGSTRSWSTRQRKFRRKCQTGVKFSSSAAWCPKTRKKDLLKVHTRCRREWRRSCGMECLRTCGRPNCA